MPFLTKELWIDFISGRVHEDTLNFPRFSIQQVNGARQSK